MRLSKYIIASALMFLPSQGQNVVIDFIATANVAATGTVWTDSGAVDTSNTGITAWSASGAINM